MINKILEIGNHYLVNFGQKITCKYLDQKAVKTPEKEVVNSRSGTMKKLRNQSKKIQNGKDKRNTWLEMIKNVEPSTKIEWKSDYLLFSREIVASTKPKNLLSK